MAALRAEGIPASVSHTAGTFVRDHVFYGLMRLPRPSTPACAGFVHVPFSPEQAEGRDSPALRATGGTPHWPRTPKRPPANRGALRH